MDKSGCMSSTEMRMAVEEAGKNHISVHAVFHKGWISIFKPGLGYSSDPLV